MTMRTFVMSSERIEDVDLLTEPDVVGPCLTPKTSNAFAATTFMSPMTGGLSGSLSFVLRLALTAILAVLVFVCHHGVLLICLASSMSRYGAPRLRRLLSHLSSVA
ncbi:hypothetical protein MRX96_009683 [Rhipicephalus microplus]